ncbi:MAG: hypothetical protein AB1758_08550 [Candidatus Eremiobacterota bacterium]
MAEPLYILSDRPCPEVLELLQEDASAGLVLLARGLLTEPGLFEGRDVYCLEEEVRELGLEGKLPAVVKALAARDLVSLIGERSVLSIE